MAAAPRKMLPSALATYAPPAPSSSCPLKTAAAVAPRKVSSVQFCRSGSTSRQLARAPEQDAQLARTARRSFSTMRSDADAGAAPPSSELSLRMPKASTCCAPRSGACDSAERSGTSADGRWPRRRRPKRSRR